MFRRATRAVGSLAQAIWLRIRWSRIPPRLRIVADLPGMIRMDEADRLYRLASAVTDGCIVEVGSYRGRSTTALALGALAGGGRPVYAVEPHEPFTGALGGSFGPQDRAEFYRSMLRSGAYEIVRLVNLSSEVIARGWSQPVALLWIDGDHTYEGVLRDFRSWEPHLTRDAVIAFDDADHVELGPHRLVTELLAGPEAFTELEPVGKIRILQRRKAS